MFVSANGAPAETDKGSLVAVPVLDTVTVWAAVADPTASLPNDSDVGEAVSTGPEGFVVDIVMLCTMSGALALVTFRRGSAPPFCASLDALSRLAARSPWSKVPVTLVEKRSSHFW